MSLQDIERTRLVLKTDGAPAIVSLQDKVISLRSHETVPENPPTYDPHANGLAAKAVQQVKAKLRIIKIGL